MEFSTFDLVFLNNKLSYLNTYWKRLKQEGLINVNTFTQYTCFQYHNVMKTKNILNNNLWI